MRWCAGRMWCGPVVCVCVFMWSCWGPPRRQIIAAVVVRGCFRLKAVRGALERDDSIIRQALRTDTKRRFSAAPLLPVRRWLQCLRTLPLFLRAESTVLALSYTSFCFLLISVLMYLAFMFPTKSVLSVNSNYPPFLSLNQSFGDRSCVCLPSKQLWLRCWPRFTVLLEQYVPLCLGF